MVEQNVQNVQNEQVVHGEHLFTCPCGQKHKSRTTVYNHTKRSQNSSQNVQNVHLNCSENVQNVQMDSVQTVQKIELKPEADKMTETIEPKKTEEPKTVERRYECGNCHKKFDADERPQACPYCRCEYD